MRLLEADLAKVNDFYLRKLAALKAIWATLMRKVRGGSGPCGRWVVSARGSCAVEACPRPHAPGQVEHDQGGRHPHRSEAETEALQAEFHALYVEVNLLRDYSSLNYTGFSKILKKHDKTLPHFAMRRRFFEERINCLPVFGILDELYRLQAETQVRPPPSRHARVGSAPLSALRREFLPRSGPTACLRERLCGLQPAGRGDLLWRSAGAGHERDPKELR